MTAEPGQGCPDLDLETVEAFLNRISPSPVEAVEPLSGGFWSTAFAFRLADRQLVVRFGKVKEGFEADRSAMAYDRPDLPVPAVLEIGDALGGSYAISERRHGRFLESVRPDEADAAGPTVVRLLRALRSVPPPLPTPTDGNGDDRWRAWLLGGLVDDPTQRVGGWRATLAGDDRLDRLFRACESEVERLAEACPERRDLVHGDLLHGNVLIDDRAEQINAVFSWKCSVRGDFLFDAAWCTFWGAFHPGIDRADILAGVLRDRSDADDADAFVDVAERHHCYELQIGATHLGWYAWTQDEAGMRTVSAHTAEVLERGPLRLPIL